MVFAENEAKSLTSSVVVSTDLTRIVNQRSETRTDRLSQQAGRLLSSILVATRTEGQLAMQLKSMHEGYRLHDRSRSCCFRERRILTDCIRCHPNASPKSVTVSTSATLQDGYTSMMPPSGYMSGFRTRTPS